MLFVFSKIINSPTTLGDAWIVRGHVRISNVFLLRPEGTDFYVEATTTPFTVEDWGDDTMGLLRENDAAILSGSSSNPMLLGLNEAKFKLSRKFDLKMEKRFPKHRFNGNCVLSRIGRTL